MRGIPLGRQVKVAEVPCPPLAWSTRLASNFAWYSGVSGAPWPRPNGLPGSWGGWPTAPGTRALVHWPFQSGYLASSKASAPVAATITAAAMTAPIMLRLGMPVLLFRLVWLPRAGLARVFEAN